MTIAKGLSVSLIATAAAVSFAAAQDRSLGPQPHPLAVLAAVVDQAQEGHRRTVGGAVQRRLAVGVFLDGSPAARDDAEGWPRDEGRRWTSSGMTIRPSH